MQARSAVLAALLLVVLGTLALNAKRSMSANVEVAPNPVHSGDALAITSALTNNTNDVQNVTVRVEVSGPCGLTASRGYKVLLNGHESDTSKALFQAPGCAGDYRAVLTISNHDGTILGTATTPFAVAARPAASR